MNARVCVCVCVFACVSLLVGSLSTFLPAKRCDPTELTRKQTHTKIQVAQPQRMTFASVCAWLTVIECVLAARGWGGLFEKMEHKWKGCMRLWLGDTHPWTHSVLLGRASAGCQDNWSMKLFHLADHLFLSLSVQANGSFFSLVMTEQWCPVKCWLYHKTPH